MIRSYFRQALLAGPVCVALAACSATEELEKAADPALEAAAAYREDLAARSIRDDVTWLADDAREGREAGTPAYDEAAQYTADRLAAYGVEPGNGDSFFQDVALRITKRDDDAAAFLIEDSEGAKISLIHKEDYIAGRNPQGTPFSVTAPVVFAGYGVSGDGYDSYAGLDVDGKIVLVFSGAPSDMNSEIQAHSSSSRTKAKLAGENGAVGLITMSANPEADPDRFKAGANRPDNGRWGWVDPQGMANVPSPNVAPVFALGPSGAEKLFRETSVDLADLKMQAKEQTRENPLEGQSLYVTATLKGGGIIEDLTSPNVVGILPGADPRLRDEYIVLSAHLDHVGVHEPRNGEPDENGDIDTIHNGAMDNAMGIATLIDVARRFEQEGRPARSVIFLAVTAEEKGLVGSDYFAHYPTINADKIVANVNLDMPLVLYPFTDVIAFGADRSTIGPLVRMAGEKAGVGVIDDPYPNLSLFVRSDHYSFVRQGVPSVFLFLGTGNGGKEVFETFMTTNYHQPSDEVDQGISWPDASRFAEVNYQIARALADADDAPVWNDGDYFGEQFGR